MDNSGPECSGKEELLKEEVNAWSKYWVKFYGLNTPKAELDRLMDTAARASSALHEHAAQCPICKASKK
jgi:hypothetical protein